MGIRKDSEKIIERILSQAIKSGNIRAAICVSYEQLAADMEQKTANYCKVCVQYLEQKKLIEAEPDKRNSDFVFLTATSDAIDFLES